MSLDPKALATVGALVFNPKGEALFVRTWKWKDLWGVPGGKIEFGEPMDVALQREFLEETGLILGPPSFLMVQEAILDSEFHKASHMILLNFTAKVVGGHLLLNDEAQEACWMQPDLALKHLNLNRVTRVLVARYLQQGGDEE